MEEYQIVGYDECVVCHQDQVGSLWSTIKKGVKKVGKAVGKVGKAVVKSPLVKVVATGAAFVFPPLGVPALAAVGTANSLIAATKDVKKAAKAIGVIDRTRQLAKKGDPGAQRAVKLLANAARAQAGKVAARKPPAKTQPRPPAKTQPRPPAKTQPRPPAKTQPRPAAPKTAVTPPPVAGVIIYTEGPNRGRIDFSGSRWRRA